MPPVLRSQADDLGDSVSRETGTVFSPKEDLTRQEFKDDADINTILRRAGGDAFSRPASYGVNDFDLDLQSAYISMAELRAGYDRLPVHLREQFPTLSDLLGAVANGEEIPFIPPEESADPPPSPPVGASEAR